MAIFLIHRDLGALAAGRNLCVLKLDDQLRAEVVVWTVGIPPRVGDDPRFPNRVVLRMMDVPVDPDQWPCPLDQNFQARGVGAADRILNADLAAASERTVRDG